jgi:hypothetical protein
MIKSTITCDRCGVGIKRDPYGRPEYLAVTVTLNSSGPVPAVAGWSDTDKYQFCFDCWKRDEVRGALLDLVKVKHQNGWTKWAKRSEVEKDTP